MTTIPPHSGSEVGILSEICDGLQLVTSPGVTGELDGCWTTVNSTSIISLVYFFQRPLWSMRRDSIFYRLFQQSPTLLFELLSTPPANAADYRFDSVAVKEPKFEIDGVFLPPDTGSPGVVYFCEVQFQKDERLYERLFGEAFLYFYRNRERYLDWQTVVIYPSRSLEQSEVYPYRTLLGSDQVHRVYLNELGEIRQLPVGRSADATDYCAGRSVTRRGTILVGTLTALRR